MNRRHFINMIGMASAGMVLDPERLLWVHGFRKIFVPASPVLLNPWKGYLVSANIIWHDLTPAEYRKFNTIKVLQ